MYFQDMVQMLSTGFICSFMGEKQRVTSRADRLESSVSQAGGVWFWNTEFGGISEQWENQIWVGSGCLWEGPLPFPDVDRNRVGKQICQDRGVHPFNQDHVKRRRLKSLCPASHWLLPFAGCSAVPALCLQKQTGL